MLSDLLRDHWPSLVWIAATLAAFGAVRIAWS